MKTPLLTEKKLAKLIGRANADLIFNDDDLRDQFVMRELIMGDQYDPNISLHHERPIYIYWAFDNRCERYKRVSLSKLFSEAFDDSTHEDIERAVTDLKSIVKMMESRLRREKAISAPA